MPSKFDPYYEWLDIESHERPLTPYLLLGLENFEEDQELIASAAEERIEYVEQFRQGEHAEAAAKVLKQLREAQGCLLSAKKKAKYDAKLRDHQTTSGVGSAPPPVSGVAQAVAPPKGKAPPVAKPVGQASPAQAPPIASPPPAGEIPRASAVPRAAAPPPEKTYTGRRRQNPWILIGSGAAVVAVLLGVLGWIVLQNDKGKEYVSIHEREAAKKQAEEAEAAEAKSEPAEPVSLEDPTLAGPSLSDPTETPAPETEVIDTTPSPDEGGEKQTPPVQEPNKPEEPNEIAWALSEDPSEKTPTLLTLEKLQPVTPSFNVASFAMSPLDQTFACASEGNIVQVWNLETGSAFEGLRLTGDRVLAVACLSPEKTLVWTDKNGLQTYANADASLVETWSDIPASSQHAPEARPDLGMAVSPGGKYFTLIRDGIRFYQTADGKLSGIVPLPPREEVVAQAFHPKGDKFYYVVQSTRAPMFYRVVRVNLKDGKSDEGKNRQRPGNLLTSPMPPRIEFLTDGDYQYLFVGNRFVLNHDDGAISLWISGTPPDYWLPLGNGQVWTMSTSGKSGVGALDWATMAKAVQDQDRSSGVTQVGNGAEVHVDLRIGATSSVPADQAKARLQQAVENRLKAEGMVPSDPNSETRLTVEYKESPSGKVSSVNCVDAEGNVINKTFEESVPDVLGEVTLTYYSQGLGKKLFFQGSSVPPDYMICPADKADGSLKQAHGAAAMEGAASLITSMIMNYYYSEGLVGTKMLPIVQKRLK